MEAVGGKDDVKAIQKLSGSALQALKYPNELSWRQGTHPCTDLSPSPCRDRLEHPALSKGALLPHATAVPGKQRGTSE